MDQQSKLHREVYFPRKPISILYRGYMQIVSLTSKVQVIGLSRIEQHINSGKVALIAVVHQDALLFPYFFRKRNVLVMISQSRTADVMAGLLKDCGFVVVRGGSDGGGKQALDVMAEYLESRKSSVASLVVDGPNGPPLKVKRGILCLAQRINAPIWIIRCNVKRKIIFKTWDRRVLPLPFNRVTVTTTGPFIFQSEGTADDLEAIRNSMEESLHS